MLGSWASGWQNIRSTAKTKEVHLPMLLQTLRALRKKTRPYLPHQSTPMALENEHSMLKNIEEIAFMKAHDHVPG